MIKQWVLALPFVKEELINAFRMAQKDLEEGFNDDVEKRAEELAKEKLSKLLSVVDERMIISFSDREKAIYIGGEKILDPGRLQSMKSEAEALLSMDLWQILSETPKRLAQKALFEDDGESLALHIKGRAVLYTLDTQKRILETLKSYSQPKKS